MSRVEVQKLVIQAVIDSQSAKAIRGDYWVGGQVAKALRVPSLQRAEFRRQVAGILQDCFCEGDTDPNTVSRRVADWVMEALQ